MDDAAKDAAMELVTRTIPPMDPSVGEALLRETKQIMDSLGVTFFLRQGTCLGAVRDGAFIPWDDDLDIGSIYGMHGMTRRSVGPVAAAFREHGFYVKRSTIGNDTYLAMMKYNMRVDWLCFRIRNGNVVHFPAVPIPVRLFAELKEIEFIGERFLVPNPPEEYLRFKYGPNWVTPTRIGYERDVVDNIPDGPIPGRAGRLRRLLTLLFLPWRTTRVKVLDANGEPVPSAEVRVIGLGTARTNSKGYARLYIPGDETFALVVRQGDVEEVIYEEQMAPGKTYVYRPDPSAPAGRIFILSEE